MSAVVTVLKAFGKFAAQQYEEKLKLRWIKNLP